MESRWLLAKLTPMKSILCIVRSHQGIFGTAISDPYLGFASPLASVKTLSEVEGVIQAHKPGALALGWSMNPHQSLVDRRLHRDRLLEYDWKIPLVCAIEESHQISLEEAMRRKETEWDMWEEIDPTDGEASTEAAVALNGWLWEHCGGWRNTFGWYNDEQFLTCVQSSIETNFGICFKKMEVPV
jgi:hypothetical protein